MNIKLELHTTVTIRASNFVSSVVGWKITRFQKRISNWSRIQQPLLESEKIARGGWNHNRLSKNEHQTGTTCRGKKFEQKKFRKKLRFRRSSNSTPQIFTAVPKSKLQRWLSPERNRVRTPLEDIYILCSVYQLYIAVSEKFSAGKKRDR